MAYLPPKLSKLINRLLLMCLLTIGCVAAAPCISYSKSLTDLVSAAERGDSMAALELGSMYENGKNVQKDLNSAIRWYTIAANNGSTKAQENLGWMYYDGIGVLKDYVQSLQWYIKAAKQGSSLAEAVIGSYYEYGYGVAIDYDAAIKWYTAAAEHGNIQAQSDMNRLKASHVKTAQFSGCDQLESILKERQDVGLQATQITSNQRYSVSCKILVHYSGINARAREALIRDGAWCRKPDSLLEQFTAAQGQIDIAKSNWCEAANNNAKQDKIAHQKQQQQQIQVDSSEDDDGSTACQLGWFIAQLACLSLSGPTSGIDQMNCMSQMVKSSNKQCQ